MVKKNEGRPWRSGGYMSKVNLEKKTILVTGAAGFIGANLVRRICEESPSSTVIGIDSLNDYYDVTLKEYRLKELEKYPSFVLFHHCISNFQKRQDISRTFPESPREVLALRRKL